jgi:hypothetical protein
MTQEQKKQVKALVGALKEVFVFREDWEHILK